MSIELTKIDRTTGDLNRFNYKISGNIEKYLEKTLLLDDFDIKKIVVSIYGEKRPLIIKTVVSPLEYRIMTNKINVSKTAFVGAYKGKTLTIYIDNEESVLSFIANEDVLIKLQEFFKKI